LLSLSFHTPDCDLEVAHLKSGSSPNVRAAECHNHWAAFGTAHPMRTGIIKGLRTIRGLGKTTADACVVGGLACWQQYAHHSSGLSERQSGAKFGLDARKLGRGSSSDQRCCQDLAGGLVGVRLLLEAIASAGSPARLR
jgi:hypothetical protein